MPTTTFRNLPPEKRDKLTAAIKDELARVPFDKVSINKIIQAAGIPRGSFYQYFTGKEDMLTYILDGYRDIMLDRIALSLRASGGDLFLMFSDMLSHALDFADNIRHMRLLRRLLSDGQSSFNMFDHKPEKSACLEKLAGIRSLIDTTKLDIRQEGELEEMVSVMLSICAAVVMEAMHHPSEIKEIRSKYNKRLELVARGFLKLKS
ncbi:MAG: TetR family transcriptional regulator [Eubacteriales bacterium]